MKADTDLDGFVDVVVWVQWQCYGVEFDDTTDPPFSGSAEVQGEIYLQLDPTQPYIPMADLTDEIVMSWVYGSGVNKLAVEAEVQALIDEQKNTTVNNGVYNA